MSWCEKKKLHWCCSHPFPVFLFSSLQGTCLCKVLLWRKDLERNQEDWRDKSGNLVFRLIYIDIITGVCSGAFWRTSKACGGINKQKNVRFYLREEPAIVSGQNHFSHILQSLQTQHVCCQDDLTEGQKGQLTIAQDRLLHRIGITTFLQMCLKSLETALQ